MNPTLPARITICLVLFLLGVPSAAAQHQSLTGWFSFTVADYPPESGLAAETTYTLTEDSGARHELLIDRELRQPLGGPVTLNCKRVTIVGAWENDPLQFRVHSIELAPSRSTDVPGRPFASNLFPDEPPPPRSALPAAEADSHVRGSQAWVTILREEPFPQGLNGTFPIPDFPRPGETKRLQWEEALQNFVIIP